MNSVFEKMHQDDWRPPIPDRDREEGAVPESLWLWDDWEELQEEKWRDDDE